METYQSAVKKIRTELTGNLDDVKRKFTSHFNADLERFIDSTAQAFLSWLRKWRVVSALQRLSRIL